MLMELARLTITNKIIICCFDRKSKPDLRSTKSHKILLLSTDDQLGKGLKGKQYMYAAV